MRPPEMTGMSLEAPVKVEGTESCWRRWRRWWGTAKDSAEGGDGDAFRAIWSEVDMRICLSWAA